MSIGGLVLGVTPADLTDRFWSKISQHPSGCWIWTAAVSSRGYGQWGFRGVSRSTHRLTYEAFVGPIPTHLVIDHLCRNVRCCNPDHLEVVTPAENNRRREVSIRARRKTHCKRGHELVPENLYLNKPSRDCRLCHNERRREAYATAKAHPVPLAEGDQRHGTRSGYAKHGCRCEACTSAWAAYIRDYRARLAAERSAS